MERILVADVMTRNPYTVAPNTSVFECAKIMVKKRVNSLSITNEKKLVGFVSQKDILWALVKKPRADFSKIKAMDLSPKKIVTVRPNAMLKEVVDKMNKFKFDRIPVVNNGRLIGLITVRDILGFHPELYPELEEFAKIRGESEKLKRIEQAKESDFSEGVCEQCGLRDTLTRFNGMMVCESCKNLM